MSARHEDDLSIAVARLLEAVNCYHAALAEVVQSVSDSADESESDSPNESEAEG